MKDHSFCAIMVLRIGSFSSNKLRKRHAWDVVYCFEQQIDYRLSGREEAKRDSYYEYSGWPVVVLCISAVVDLLPIPFLSCQRVAVSLLERISRLYLVGSLDRHLSSWNTFPRAEIFVELKPHSHIALVRLFHSWFGIFIEPGLNKVSFKVTLSYKTSFKMTVPCKEFFKLTVSCKG